MKKIFGVCLILLILLGCHHPSSDDLPVKEVDESMWAGEYVLDDTTLTIIQDIDNGISFRIKCGKAGFYDEAMYLDQDHLQAVCESSLDGYSLHFTLQKDQIQVNEDGDVSTLDKNISGVYRRK
jgi:hypothetical protein